MLPIFVNVKKYIQYNLIVCKHIIICKEQKLKFQLSAAFHLNSALPRSSGTICMIVKCTMVNTCTVSIAKLRLAGIINCDDLIIFMPSYQIIVTLLWKMYANTLVITGKMMNTISSCFSAGREEKGNHLKEKIICIWLSHRVQDSHNDRLYSIKII